MNKIAITGAPCTGKTDFIKWLTTNYKSIYCLPEVASILKNMGFPFDNIDERRIFQRSVYDLQVLFENWVELHCKQDDILMCDRGTLDAFAYCDLCDVMDDNYQDEYKRYKAVFHFRTSSNPDDYENLKGNNSLRDENYERVLDLDKNLFNIWNAHPKYYEIPWEIDRSVKYENVRRLLFSILNTEGDGYDCK